MGLVESQVLIFLTTLYAGLILGALYDVTRVVESAVRIKALGAVIEAAYFVFAFAAAVLVFYFTNRMEVRFYTFTGLALGFILYMAGISRAIRLLAAKVGERARGKRERAASRRDRQKP